MPQKMIVLGQDDCTLIVLPDNSDGSLVNTAPQVVGSRLKNPAAVALGTLGGIASVKAAQRKKNGKFRKR